MTNLNSRSALHPRWTRSPLTVLRAFESVMISIFDPNSELSGWGYDPYAPVGGDGFGFGEGPFGEDSFGGGGAGYPGGTSVPTELWRGSAQMQVFRQTLNADDVAGSVTQLRSVRFTADLDGPGFPVRKGLIVRVTSCPHDPAAESFEYIVTSGLNSGLAFKRTIETESDQSVIADPITDFIPWVS